MKSKRISLTVIAILFIGFVASAQEALILTESDYQHATSMLSGNVNKLIDNAIRPQWTPDGRIWYRSLTEDHSEYKLVNPNKKKVLIADSRKELFEKGKVDQGSERR
jgi:dipeptidyl-peptidase-4